MRNQSSYSSLKLFIHTASVSTQTVLLHLQVITQFLNAQRLLHLIGLDGTRGQLIFFNINQGLASSFTDTRP
eukprot:c20011_g2_i1 orf=103-318(+)